MSENEIPVPDEIVGDLCPIFGDRLLAERFLDDVDYSSDEGEQSVWQSLRSRPETEQEEMARKTQQAPVQKTTLDRFLKSPYPEENDPKSDGRTKTADHNLSDSDSHNVNNEEESTSNASLNKTDLANNSLFNTSSCSRETWHEKLKKKYSRDCLDNINFDDADNKDTLFAEDLDEDNEVYVIQCPKDMDPALFLHQKLNLEGESVFLFNSEKGEECFQSLSEQETGDRCVNIVLPSRESKKFKMISHPLAGSIVITESMDVPNIDVEPQPSPQHFSLPEVVMEKLRTSFSENTLIESFCEGSPKKKKKKHRIKLEPPEELDTAPASNTEEVCLPEKKKKKKKKHTVESQDNEYAVPHLHISDVSAIEDCSLIKKKKKKDKHKDQAPEELVIAPAPNTEEVCVPTKKKKKKKKHSENEDNGLSNSVLKNEADKGVSEMDTILKSIKREREDDGYEMASNNNSFGEDFVAQVAKKIKQEVVDY